MAQYEHLPIYTQTCDILLRTLTATKDFPRRRTGAKWQGFIMSLKPQYPAPLQNIDSPSPEILWPLLFLCRAKSDIMTYYQSRRGEGIFS
jgi:hypothetical protein